MKINIWHSWPSLQVLRICFHRLKPLSVARKKTFPLATVWVTTAIRFVHYIKHVPVINMNKKYAIGYFKVEPRNLFVNALFELVYRNNDYSKRYFLLIHDKKLERLVHFGHDLLHKQYKGIILIHESTSVSAYCVLK